jgi:hypothetical protein
MEEFSQTPQNLMMAAQNLRELVHGGNIVLYPDANMRLSASRTIATEMTRGFRIDRAKQSHKIDVIAALSFACYGAINLQVEGGVVEWMLRNPEETAAMTMTGIASAGNMNNNGYGNNRGPNGELGERGMAQLAYRSGNSMFTGGSGRIIAGDHRWRPGFR